MAETRRWSFSLKDVGDFLSLVREIALLSMLAVLLIDASRITPILTEIGLALEQAGFTELNIGGIKQDLTKLREKMQDTGLNTQQAHESLAKAITLLQKKKGEISKSTVDSGIDEVIALIASSQAHLGFAKQQIQEAASVAFPAVASPAQLAITDNKPWAIIVGADRTLAAAQDELKAAKSKGFENVRILLRDDWYRTAISFATEQQANAKLPEVVKQIREGAYVRDLNKWCGKLQLRVSDTGEFEECVPR